MKKLASLTNKYAATISMAILLIIWQGAGYLNLLPKYIIPTPVEIVKAFVKNYQLLIFHSKITLLEAIIGLSLGIIIAWTLALIMDSIPLFNKAVYPLLVLTQTIPTIAIAPILVLWLGYGLTPKIVLIVITTTFPIVVSILDGFRNCDKDMITLLKLMKASKFQILWHVKIPTSLSYFYAGLRVSVSYAFIAAVVAEWLGGFDGLGVYMTRVRKSYSFDKMFAVIFFISIISLLLMYLVKKIQILSMPWENDENK